MCRCPAQSVSCEYSSSPCSLLFFGPTHSCVLAPNWGFVLCTNILLVHSSIFWNSGNTLVTFSSSFSLLHAPFILLFSSLHSFIHGRGSPWLLCPFWSRCIGYDGSYVLSIRKKHTDCQSTYSISLTTGVASRCLYGDVVSLRRWEASSASPLTFVPKILHITSPKVRRSHLVLTIVYTFKQ